MVTVGDFYTFHLLHLFWFEVLVTANDETAIFCCREFAVSLLVCRPIANVFQTSDMYYFFAPCAAQCYPDPTTESRSEIIENAVSFYFKSCRLVYFYYFLRSLKG